MARAEYVVDLQDGVWTVALNGARHGPYSSQTTAIQAAVGAARKAEGMGHEAHVIIHNAPDEALEAPAIASKAA